MAAAQDRRCPSPGGRLSPYPGRSWTTARRRSGVAITATRVRCSGEVPAPPALGPHRPAAPSYRRPQARAGLPGHVVPLAADEQPATLGLGPVLPVRPGDLGFGECRVLLEAGRPRGRV